MRIVLVGGSGRGKSTLAAELRAAGVPTFCADPLSKVRQPEPAVTYLPEGLGWGGASWYVARHWLPMPEPWCIEGIATARALRKVALAGASDSLRGVEIRVFREARGETSPRQEATARQVATIWGQVASLYPWAVEV